MASVGELFILGFRGPTVPQWLCDFAKVHSLGGVILFDYDVQTKTYRNNVESRDQLEQLCREIHALPSRPLIYIDQEGGKVRRLKEGLGFAPLPSAKEFAPLSGMKKRELLMRSLRELKEIGIDVDLAPVADLDINPLNPDIGAIGRSFSSSLDVVRENIALWSEIAAEVNLGLCLKHFPGLGSATTNSHVELTDLTGTITEAQLKLFREEAPKIPGNSILVSHGLVNDWDPGVPVSMSFPVLQNLRSHLPNTLFVSDDLQMQGLQARFSSVEGVIRGVGAGLDAVILGNNLLDEQQELSDYAEALKKEIASDRLLAKRVEESVARVVLRKAR